MNQKAFTLIELLVVIAIIAILAAILFPIFLQAKVAAKKTQSLSNHKQIATAITIYLTDNDDIFPFGYGRHPDKTRYPHEIHPIPYNALTVGGWDTPGKHEAALQFWANSVHPYLKNWEIHYQPDQKKVEIPGVTYLSGVPTIYGGITYNGLLHNFPNGNLENPSLVTLVWPGYGLVAAKNVSRSMPVLNCSNHGIELCRFQSDKGPQGDASVSCSGTSGGPPWGSCWYVLVPNNYFVWMYAKTMPMARADTSVKAIKVGTVINPSAGSPPSADWRIDPFSRVNNRGTPITITYVSSRDPAPDREKYWGFFRPDRKE